MIQGKLTISRVHSNTEDNYIEVRLCDPDAAIEFVTAKLSLADFASALTGLGRVPCELETRGLENVGKKLVTKTLEFPMLPDSDSGDKEAAIAAAKLRCPQGWTPDLYFGSQSSFFQRDGEPWARTTVRRWVEKEVTT